MSIFQREGGEGAGPITSPSGRPGPPSGAKKTTIVAAGSRVKGEISGATDVLIDGQLEGQLALGGTVVVGEAGEVEGQIQARQVKIGGRIRGDIRASERVEVLASGRIEGDVSAPRVAINAGAFFKGKVEMTQDEVEAKPTVQAKVASEPKPEDKGTAQRQAQPEQKRLDHGAESPSSAAAES